MSWCARASSASWSELTGAHPRRSGVSCADFFTCYGTSSNKRRTHGDRFSVQHSTNRHGTTYEYFVCAGRHDKRSDCRQRAILIDEMETRVTDLYATVSLTAELRQQLEVELVDMLSSAVEDAELVRATLLKQESDIRERQRKLLEAHYAAAVPLELLRSEQDQMARQLAAITGRLTASDVRFEVLETNLKVALDLAQDCYSAYSIAPNHVRRWFNQTFFSRILITDEEANGEMTGALQCVTTAARGAGGRGEENKEPRPRISLGQGSDEELLVDLRGFEPLTPCMPCRCATSCATDP